MAIVALITWIVAALGGAYLLITWLVRGGLRQQRTKTTSFPITLIFGHFLLAATGLVLWILYLFFDARGFAWAAFVVLLGVATLGTTMFARWGSEDFKDPPPAAERPPAPRVTPQRDGPARGRGGTTTVTVQTEAERAAESHFPLTIVAAHGAFAATTLVAVLLTALGVGVGIT